MYSSTWDDLAPHWPLTRKHSSLHEGLEGPNPAAVAEACETVARAYTELGEVGQAFAYLNKAAVIHTAHDPSTMSGVLAIRALACLRAGAGDDALAALHLCWLLQGMTQEQIETSKHPKHGGDMLLLVRILWLQGKRADAFQLVERVLAMRETAYRGSRGLRFWDALFVKSLMQDEDGDPGQAALTVRRVIDVDVGENRQELTPQQARAGWFYARYTAKLGATATSNAARESALSARSGIAGREWPDEDTDEGFMRLVPWMLW
jgi:hypothetical protein